MSPLARGHHRQDVHDWDVIQKRLVVYASKRLRGTGGVERAEHIARQALCIYFRRHGGPPENAKDEDILRQLGSIVNGEVQNYFRTKSEAAMDNAVELEPQMAMRDGDSIERRLDARRTMNLLLDRVAGNAPLEDMLLLMLTENIMEPADLAPRLQLDVAEVYKAKSRLMRLYDAVKAEQTQGRRP